ncbi:expressed protein [Chlorella variabilis]|uniref:Expressed protein n=1 Tax=Chlorella variabilis TaxID=554065 RepID=E1Z2T1_CHLVA|nr:expressed protein [Chlorella variabilis]EFN60051.1 expressed protein [Chlorella variabilis]|eukprot:XP_005852153.1 expressed protein [Chlorella variabilis]
MCVETKSRPVQVPAAVAAATHLARGASSSAAGLGSGSPACPSCGSTMVGQGLASAASGPAKFKFYWCSACKVCVLSGVPGIA